jgi:hypothetical protein
MSPFMLNQLLLEFYTLTFLLKETPGIQGSWQCPLINIGPPQWPPLIELRLFQSYGLLSIGAWNQHWVSRACSSLSLLLSLSLSFIYK